MALAQQFTGNPANHLVIRLSARLKEQSRLSEIAFSVIIAFTCIGAGMAAMKQIESMQHHVVYETDVSFELTAPPPEAPVLKKQAAPMPTVLKHAMLASAPMIHPKAIETPVKQEMVTPSTAPTVPTVNSLDAPSLTAATPAAPTASAPASTGVAATAPPNSSNGAVQLTPDMTAIAGGDFGAQHLAPVTAMAPKLGNIKPYKLDLLRRLTANWHPTAKDCGRIVLELSIAHDGSLMTNRIVQSSGDPAIDQDLIGAVEMTHFAPLPDWFKGEKLTWKLDLSAATGS